MLAPKRVKFRKWQKGRLRGPALRGATIAFGDIGLKTVEHGKLTNQQIEAARIAMMRHIKRGGKVWIRVFPDHPVTAKPLKPVRVPVRAPRWVGALRSSPAASCTKSRASASSWPRKPSPAPRTSCRSRQ